MSAPRPDGDAEDWMIKGECRNHDPEDWFAKRQNRTAIARARTRCWQLCPVRETCLHYALKYQQEVGMWGGLTALERRKLDPRIVTLILRGEKPVELPNASRWEFCGTEKGAARHRRAGERVCRSCLAAEARRQSNKWKAKHG